MTHIPSNGSTGGVLLLLLSPSKTTAKSLGGIRGLEIGRSNAHSGRRATDGFKAVLLRDRVFLFDLAFFFTICTLGLWPGCDRLLFNFHYFRPHVYVYLKTFDSGRNSATPPPQTDLSPPVRGETLPLDLAPK